MDSLKKIKDNICRELDKMSNMDNLNSASLDALDKLTHTLKSIETINAMEQKYSNDYSRDGYSGDYSYARNRDSLGRYSRDGYSGRMYRDGYSGHSDIKSKLEDMKRTAQNDHERQMIEEWMHNL